MPDEFAADEIRAALVWTRRAADDQFDTAYDLLTRLPAVHAALHAGRVDEPRARILATWTADLTGEQARALCAALLPLVGSLTTGQLIERIKRRAIALDPDWARRRYETALAERRVIGTRNPDGSANLAGLNLPVDRVAAASGRIDALARSVKNAGDARPIDHIRAELFLGMTDGTYTGLDDTAILALHRHHHTNTATATDSDGDGGDGDAEAGTGGDAEARDGDATGDVNATGEPDEEVGGEPVRPPRRAGGLELRVQLTTLLGHNEHPGELAGWGPIHAGLSRDLTGTLTGARWHYAITGPDGHLLHAGLTRRRPTGTTRTRDPRAGGTHNLVELQIPATLLASLAADPAAAGPWAPVITDLAHQYTDTDDPYAGDTSKRAPGAALRRYLQTRDRRCIGPCCRAPARTADQDHTTDHDHGGPTTDDNLGSVCKHDHRLKHAGGWRLHQHQPGHFTWTSRLGQRYEIHPPPIIEPLPDPMPAHRPPDQPVIRINADDPILEDEPEHPPEPGPPPEPDPADDIPPF